ncbi:MAG: T9SS type A sorting domain-containing protein, partial [Bacteroidales bacterium]
DKKRSEHFDNMYQYYRKDTLNPQASADSLVLLLAQDNRLESKYRLAFLNLKNGAWSATQQLLSSIPIQFELTSLEAAVHQDYVLLFSVLNQLNGELPAEGSQEATDLELLAEKDEHYPGACARNLLIVAGLMDYDEPVVLPEEELKSAEIFNHDLFNDPGKSEALTIFPNPAGNYFIINYNAEDYTGEISIKVSNMNGKLLVTKQYTLRRNQEVINVADWKAGIYNISLMINGKIINTKKITVAH